MNKRDLCGRAGVRIALGLLLAGGLGVAVLLAWPGSEPADPPSVHRIAGIDDAEHLDAVLEPLDYRLDLVADGQSVPRLRVDSVPQDLGRLTEPDARKDMFVRILLPLILLANEEVAEERRHLEKIAGQLSRSERLSTADQAWLDDMAEIYDAPSGRYRINHLMRKVDTIPPSLALAQAALETGWGTSRLARRSNNLFGHTLEGGNAGMAGFPTLYHAVRAYMRNLNSHPAYEAMRSMRHQARKTGQPAGGLGLTVALDGYSERGRAYAVAVRAMIRNNDLARFDRARLRGSDSTRI